MPGCSRIPSLPLAAGIGLRTPYMREVVERRPSAGWLEVHAENYMGAGHQACELEKIRNHYALSIHGVGLSLGSVAGVDAAHLKRLKALCDRFEPAMVSEHVAWSVGDGIFLNDLLPVPYDDDALDVLSANIAQTQDVLKRQILVENISSYVGFARSTMDEPEFLSELVSRTGCGLLLDVNNVYVSARNMGFDPQDYIAKLPHHAVGEIHIAGHVENQTANGPVLIDNHGSCVAPAVWSLYRHALQLCGRQPTLVEWDSGLPPLSVLLGEAMWADLLASAESIEVMQVLNATSDVPVALCDHHPLSNRTRMLEDCHA